MDKKIKLLRKGERIALLSSLISFLLAILKGVVGVLSNSVVLIADALESAADIASGLTAFFGLKIVEHFNIEYGIIINKYDLNKEFSNKIEKFANKNKIQILGKIPYNKGFVKALVNLKPAVVYNKGFEKIFLGILNNLKTNNIF